MGTALGALCGRIKYRGLVGGMERQSGASGWQVVTELVDWPPGGRRRGA